MDIVLREGRIHTIRVVENRDARYARIAEAVLPRIVSAQSAGVDAITGATTSSKCFMRATADALTAAREPTAAR